MQEPPAQEAPQLVRWHEQALGRSRRDSTVAHEQVGRLNADWSGASSPNLDGATAAAYMGRVVVCNYFCVVFDFRRPTGALPGHAKCRKSFAPALALASAAACSASAALALASDFLTVASESCWASASTSARAEARRDGGGAFEPAQAAASAVAWRFLLASVVLGSDGRCEGESSLEADVRLTRPFMLPSEPSLWNCAMASPGAATLGSAWGARGDAAQMDARQTRSNVKSSQVFLCIGTLAVTTSSSPVTTSCCLAGG